MTKDLPTIVYEKFPEIKEDIERRVYMTENEWILFNWVAPLIKRTEKISPKDREYYRKLFSTIKNIAENFDDYKQSIPIYSKIDQDPLQFLQWTGATVEAMIDCGLTHEKFLEDARRAFESYKKQHALVITEKK